jgi:preprotein translocase subunit YajC
MKLFPALMYAASGTATGEAPSMTETLISLLPFVLVIIVFYFVLIRPQKKRDKADQEMRNNLKVGDIVTTRGGIIGKITNIKDQQLTIQTGADSVKIRVERWAVLSKEETVSDDE